MFSSHHQQQEKEVLAKINKKTELIIPMYMLLSDAVDDTMLVEITDSKVLEYVNDWFQDN